MEMTFGIFSSEKMFVTAVVIGIAGSQIGWILRRLLADKRGVWCGCAATSGKPGHNLKFFLVSDSFYILEEGSVLDGLPLA